MWTRPAVWPLQGLKPNVDLIGFFGTTEVVPFQSHAKREFFPSL